jgi:N6-L-threonylcarbamoyladenine synthase
VLILAVESSCDENSVAILRDGHLLSVCTRTQTIHQQFGGVVPELAGRSHLELIDPLAQEALTSAGVELRELDMIAATIGPGLIGSLLVGASYARGFALSLGKPFRGINHVEAHLWSGELGAEPMPLPFLVLLVSGGHTLLVYVTGVRQYQVLGSTLDDALGEAYDKVGKLVGLKFPAGADVDKLAAHGNSSAFPFPRSMSNGSLNFSFSGLKTAFLYTLRKLSPDEIAKSTPDLLASFQEAALESVAIKVRSAIAATRSRALVAAGGVAANSVLRAKLKKIGDENGIPCRFPEIRFCGDNAAMIAYLAWKLEQANCDDAETAVRPRWGLDTLMQMSVSAWSFQCCHC